MTKRKDGPNTMKKMKGLLSKPWAAYTFAAVSAVVVYIVLSHWVVLWKWFCSDILKLLSPVVVGVVLAAVIGYLTARAMLQIINKVSFGWFALYVFLIGAAVIAMQLTGFAGFPPISTPFS